MPEEEELFKRLAKGAAKLRPQPAPAPAAPVSKPRQEQPRYVTAYKMYQDKDYEYMTGELGRINKRLSPRNNGRAKRR